MPVESVLFMVGVFFLGFGTGMFTNLAMYYFMVRRPMKKRAEGEEEGPSKLVYDSIEEIRRIINRN